MGDNQRYECAASIRGSELIRGGGKKKQRETSIEKWRKKMEKHWARMEESS